jgi:hypothetical protein
MRNRQGQVKGGLYAAKGSGDLEYASETVMELTPDGHPDYDGVTKVQLSLHKNRHGSQGVDIDLRFSGRLQEFTVD